MTRGLKVLFVALIILIGILATSTGFFYAQTTVPKDSESNTIQTKDDTEIKNTDEENKINTPSQTVSSVNEFSSVSSRPSSPSDTHTIAIGETLAAIGIDLGVNWQELAEVSGIGDVDKVKAGQIIIIPKNGAVNFKIDNAKAKTAQNDAESGKNVWRFSALDTARADISPVYSIALSDVFKQTKVDSTTGTATISVTKGEKVFEVSLVQPLTKGSKGIWAIESVRQIKS